MTALDGLALARAPERARGRKARGLAQLVALELPVPEFVLFDEEEHRYWRETGRLSARVGDGLAGLMARVRVAGHPLLFSIRSEATSAAQGRRPPPSILNVGLGALVEPLVTRAGLRIERAQVEHNYARRVRDFVEQTGGAEVPDGGLADLLHGWVSRFFEVGSSETGAHELVVQRMVFGCADRRSGNGICCNLAGAGPERRFRGVFLPGQLGIPTTRGVWGDPQVPLREFEHINPAAHAALARCFARCEALGPNPYLEFTAEGASVYLMQYEQRQRDVTLD